MSDTGLRILHLVSAESDWEPFSFIVTMAAALREHGVVSTVTAAEHSRLWEVAEGAGVDTIDHEFQTSLNPFRWKTLGNLVKKIGAGVVHAHDPDAAAALSRARLFTGGAGTAVSRYAMRGVPASSEYGGGVGAVICQTQAMAEVFRKRGAPAEKIHVVPMGVNIAAVDRAVEEREVIRGYIKGTYCPAKEKPRFIVSIAPMDGTGGQRGLIEAMPDLLAELPQAHLFLMGEGPEREELERLAKLNAVHHDISFLEPDRAFIRFLAGADLFVANADDDCACLMLAPAMAAGLAVLARDAGGNRELLDDGNCGYVFSADADQTGFNDALIAMMKDRKGRERLGSLARTQALKTLSVREQAAKIAKIYRLVAKK